TAEYVDSNHPKVNVNYPSDQSQLQFQTLLEKNHVNFDSKGVGGSPWWGILTSLLPFVLLFGFWIFLMNQVQGGGSKVMSFGKSRAKRMAPDSPKIGFKDVAGVDEAVEELQEIKEFLENPKKFQELGARTPKRRSRMPSCAPAACSAARRAEKRSSSLPTGRIRGATPPSPMSSGGCRAATSRCT